MLMQLLSYMNCSTIPNPFEWRHTGPHEAVW